MKGRLPLLILAALGVAMALFFWLRGGGGTSGDADPPKAGEADHAEADRVDRRSILPEKFPEQKDQAGEAKPGEKPASRWAMRMEPEVALSGIDLAPATDEDRTRAGVKKKYGTGVTITKIHPDSSAAEVAMEIGDVIVRAEKENVNTVEDLKRIIGDRDHTVVNFMRDGQLLSVVLQRPFVPPPKTP